MSASASRAGRSATGDLRRNATDAATGAVVSTAPDAPPGRRPAGCRAVEPLHASQVAGKITVDHQPGQRPLGDQGRVAVTEGPGLQQRRGQPRRHHQVAQPQVRVQHLGERPQVGHVPLPVQAFQCVQRAPLEAEFTVVIVLHHQGAVAAGERQQRQAPLQAHGHAQRELMGRGHVDQTGGLRQALHARPWSSTGTGTTRAPRASNTARAGG